MALNPNAAAGGNYDPRNAIRTILTALLGNSYNPTGLGTQAPTALGPNPVRGGADLTGPGGAGQMDAGGIWAALAPFIKMLGGGAGNIAGGGSVNLTPPPVSDAASAFLNKVLSSILSPAGSAPAPTPPPAGSVAPAIGSGASALFSALFGGGGGGGGGADFGGISGASSSSNVGKGPSGGFDTSGLGSPVGERGPGTGVFGQ